MNTSSKIVLLAASVVLAGCASAPPPPPAAPLVKLEQKMAWILELEDRRILKIDVPPPPAPPVVAGRRKVAPPPPPPPSSSPNLAILVADAEPRVRRRAALATGRAGLPEGVTVLVPLLADPDAEVRQMGAFALGLIGVALDDGSQPHTALTPSVAPLTTALADADPLVRGRAAEALGQIGAREAAAAIGKVAAEYARTPAVAAMKPDDEKWPSSPEADAFRLALFALVRLRAYEPIASAVLDQNGRPISSWWPVAYALQRVGDKRAQHALIELSRTPGKYTASFAVRGIGALKDPVAAKPLMELLDPARHPLEVVIAAIRAVAAAGVSEAAAPLTRLATAGDVHSNVRLEAVGALGALRATDALPAIQDLLTESWPVLRGAALRAAALIDRESFMLLLSGLDEDAHWTVRATLADVLAGLPAELALGRLRGMLNDEDKRVIPAVLGGLVRLRAPDVNDMLLARLKDSDQSVREAAARHIGELKVPGGPEALREAYRAGQGDSGYGVRAAALAALAAYGAEATDALRAGLEDQDWAVRLRAAQLLARIDPAVKAAHTIRPVPGAPTAAYGDPQLIAPPNSPHAFIETAKGSIEIELAVLDAPQTTRNFMALARKGFFNGLSIHRVVPNFVVQDGDPRGDGGGGPGYSIRDELNDRPYVRGTVGMALSWRDTGGSQFFITHSPQPHLDGRYTVFGHVVAGMEVVDRIQQGDVIQQIRIWDGKTMGSREGSSRK
jgi:cyclophilin family peptidyl-prolyl cis-trans isomerase/HEAT repeat protein